MPPSSPSPSRTPAWLQAARDQWSNRGQERPSFAIEPGPGQESVWDYPRPPAVVADSRLVEVHAGETLIARSSEAIRVLETSHPPSFYLPPESVMPSTLVSVPGRSHCEWKGQAEYLGLSPHGSPVAWRYNAPYPDFRLWAGYVSFYPDAIECRVDHELVRPQAGGFYGGWITNDVVGPFKGDANTSGW